MALLPLVVLPWLPLPVPAAFLIWAGRLRLLVWAAVLLLLAVRPARRLLTRAHVAEFVPGRPAAAAGLLSAIVFGGAAWVAAPSVPGGDEPHYLVITQSLLLDGDFRIENNHQRGDYETYFGGPLRPDYIRRGRDGEIYSIHAPGISAIVLPAFAAGGYPAVVVFLVGFAALGGALLWHVAWLATGERSAAWFGWAAVTLSPAHIFHTFTVYPDGMGGLLVLTGVWALLRGGEAGLRPGAGRQSRSDPWVWALHGAALAALPWLHTRFALLAGSLGALLLLRLSLTRDAAAKAVAFLVAPAISALCWIGYFIAIYGTPDPSAPYGATREFSTGFIPGGLAGLLFDQRFGLLATAPVLAAAAAGIATLLVAREPSPGTRASRRLALELLFIVLPYLLTATSYAMWWGGWSAPARFAAVVLPALGIPCAVAWTRLGSPAGRTIAAGALALTAFISAVLLVPQRGRLAFNTRDVPALWLDWASQVADLGRGLPLWVRGGEARFYEEIALWMVALLAASLIVRLAFARGTPASTEARATLAALVFAAAGMTAVTGTWRLNRVPGTTPAPAQLEFLRRLSSEPRVITAALYPLERIPPGEVAARMRIEPGGRYSIRGGAGRSSRPLVTLPAVPAGRYRIRPRTTGGGGLLTIGIGQDQFLLRTEPLARRPEPIEIDFPVDVRALIVNGDEEARRTMIGVAIEPVSTVPAAARLTAGYARTGVRYGAASIFFLDDRSFPEPEAFWVGGARRSSIVIQPDAGLEAITVLMRNAPVQNDVTIEAGGWRIDLDFAPGEERRISVPLDARRGATLVTFSCSAGFRPSAVEPGSRDDRVLGVWVQAVEK